MRALGSSTGTSKPTLHSSLPGRLTYEDYMRGSLASSFLLSLINEGTPPGDERREENAVPVFILLAPFLWSHHGWSHQQPKPELPLDSKSTQPSLSWGEELLPTLACSGPGEVRSPAVPAPGICIIPCGFPPSCLHLCTVY